MPVDYQTFPWKVITDEQKKQYCCLLDDINVLLIPVPQTKAEEEEIVNRFLDGVRKLFTPENNWTCLAMPRHHHGLLRAVQLLLRGLPSVRDVQRA